MKILLDTHALLYWVFQPKQLSRKADAAIRGAETVYASAVSAYEIALKFNRKNLDFARVLAVDFDAELDRQGFNPLPLMPAEAAVAGRLPVGHPDPWDRLLAAQTLLNGLLLLSNDKKIQSFDVSMLW